MPIPPESDLHLPKNMPTFFLADADIGEGWRVVPTGTLVRSSYQVFSLYPPGWRISSYSTRDRYHSNGASYYRAPASVKAWCTVLPQMVAKAWGRWTS